MSADETNEVIKVVKRWARAFSAGDWEAIMELWDSEYEPLLHQAEEYPAPLRGREEIASYNRAMSEKATGHRDHGVADFLADVIGDMAWCYLRGSITFDFEGLDKPIQGQVSQLFILRKNAAGEWKFIQYHEGRETPGLREPFLKAHPDPESVQDPLPQLYA